MNNYLALYIGCALSSDNTPSKNAHQKGMKAWGQWMEKNSEHIIDSGGPLGRTLRISKNGIEDHTNLLTGYIIVKAESQKEAALLFKNHPHFAIFPGDSIEIIECTEIPSI